MRALGAILVVLQLLAGLGMFALSVHAPSGLAFSAPIYFVVAATFTWWVARRKSWGLLALAGVLTLAVPPAIYGLLDLAERKVYERRIAATQVAEVRDEPILSVNRPIGVRLSYQVTVPARGHFAVFPAIHGNGDAAGFGLQARRWTFDGRRGIEFGPFEPGKRHAVSMELYPENYFLDSGGACVLPVTRPLPETRQPAPLRVEIYDSPYGSVRRGGREERTSGAYDMATLYRNVVASGLPPCKVPGQ